MSILADELGEEWSRGRTDKRATRMITGDRESFAVPQAARAEVRVRKNDDGGYGVTILGRTTQKEAEFVGHGEGGDLDTALERAFSYTRRHVGTLQALLDKVEEEVEEAE